MTLLYMDGIDNAMTIPKPSMIYGGNSPAVHSGRDGSTNGSYRIAGTSGTPSVFYTTDAPISTAILGFAWKANSVSTWSFRFYIGGSTTTIQCGLFPSVTGQWRFYTGAGVNLMASSDPSDVLVAASWVMVEMKLLMHTTTGIFQLRVNGEELINYTGPTALTSGAMTGMAWTAGNGGSSLEGCNLDDFYVCDDVDATATQGRPFNDFLGDIKIVTLAPEGAGDETAWTPSTGANWSTLDDNPPGSVDYVSTSGATPGTRDLYSVPNLPVDAATVLAVQPRGYALKNDVGSASYVHVIKENGVVSAGEEHAVGVTVQPYQDSILTQRPSDNTLWTVADVNAMQVGVEVA